ncbi:MAG: ATP-binding protein [Anaerolineales bacterium]
MLAWLTKIFPQPIQRRGMLFECLLFVLSYAVLLAAIPAESRARPLVENSAILTAATTAALLIFLSLAGMPTRSRRAWLLLGIAVLAWWAGAFLLDYLQSLVGPQVTISAAAHIINLLAYLLAAYALMQYPFKSHLAPTRFRFILDAIISSGVVVTLGFLLLVRPLSSTSALVNSLLVVSYPIADCILLILLANFSLANWVPRSTARFLIAAWVAFLISDYVHSSLVLIGSYGPGSFVSMGWVGGFLLMGLGAISERDMARSQTSADAESERASTLSTPGFDLGAQFQRVLPIALVLVLFWYVLTDWRLRGELSPYALWMTVLLGVMLIVRLGIRAGEAELNQYWQLFRNLAIPSFVSDPKGNVLLNNPAYGQLVQEPEAASNSRRSLFDLFDGPVRGALKKAVTADQIVNVTLRADSSPYSLALSPIATENRQVVIAGVAHDLTEQKRQRDAIQGAYDELQQVHNALEELNAQLEHKVEERTSTLQEAFRKLEEQNTVLQGLDQIKTDFVSMVSHELRAPLTNLSGGLELLLNGQHSATDQKVLLLIQAEIRRLARFVDSILDVSAMEAGRFMLHPTRLSLPAVVEEVHNGWSNLPEYARIQPEVEPDLPRVLADEAALRSVLGHLIDNALKYAPGSPVQIRVRSADGQVRVDVRDFGPGIPVEKHNLLFERFQRLEARDSQAVYGYGLGLYLSRQLLRALDSDLCFEQPEAGGGALFYFYLSPEHEE